MGGLASALVGINREQRKSKKSRTSFFGRSPSKKASKIEKKNLKEGNFDHIFQEESEDEFDMNDLDLDMQFMADLEQNRSARSEVTVTSRHVIVVVALALAIASAECGMRKFRRSLAHPEQSKCKRQPTILTTKASA